jgi:hypothetical protein
MPSIRWIGLAVTVLLTTPLRALDFPGPAPGPAAARLDGDRLQLENAAQRVTWDLAPGRERLVEAVDRASGSRWAAQSELFSIKLADGRSLASAQMRVASKPRLEKITARPDAVRLAERCAGWRAGLDFVSDDGKTRVRWQAMLRDGSNYVRQEVSVLEHDGPRPVALTVLSVPASGVVPQGTVDGSPLVVGNWFLACEHPLAKNQVKGASAVCTLPIFESPVAGLPTASAVVGVTPQGQLRRAFQYYLERERARPYRPFVYYISWFDIAAPGLKMNEAQCLEVIRTFGTELATRRGVKLDAFVFDDGWDDNQTLWQFHAGFPRGFTPHRAAAAEYGAMLGTWISPFGGYGQHKRERLESGRSQGYETNRSGFSLGGPKYHAVFRKVCEDMIRKYDIGYFKFDGMGGGSWQGPGQDYGPDMQALVQLFDELRRLRPDLFINATTGTWPSPYWLFHSDTVFRGGEDVGYAGTGSRRQRWITYRDGLGYDIRTRRGPLYPFNSLKFQSVFYAQLSLAKDLTADVPDLVDDIRMAAGSGTQLQEYFITARMMTPAAWDVVAEAIRWVQRNADVLVDSHGIGGNPAKDEVYGFASWQTRMGVLVLRNPAERPAQFAVDLQEAFELPPGAPRRYVLRTAWKQSSPPPQYRLEAGKPFSFSLAPKEVLVLGAVPADGAARD